MTLLLAMLLTFDPLQGGLQAYPTYSDYKCGSVTITAEIQGNAAMVRATTMCPGSGRGAKPIIRLACTRVVFDDAGVIVPTETGEVGERVLTASWRLGAAAVSCPGL